MVYCHYLDHSILGTFTMAGLGRHARSLFSLTDPKQDFLLITCHRVELYTNYGEEHGFVQRLQGYPLRRSYGYKSIMRRLVQIACGIRSQLLGEKSIFVQVQHAVDHLDSENPFLPIGNSALCLAEELRKTFNFFAPNDYEEIVFNILSSEIEKNNVVFPVTLIVVGSGYLGRAIATSASHYGYRRVVLVTRNPEKARKYLPEGTITEVYTFGRLPEEVLHSPFQCFTATDAPTETYQRNILGLLRQPTNQGAVDMSSLPFYKAVDLDGRPYTTMYDQLYLSQVKKNNCMLLPILPRLAKQLDALVEDRILSKNDEFIT